MSLAHYYHYKADQSAAWATAATTAEDRDSFNSDQGFWRGMAITLDQVENEFWYHPIRKK